MQVGALGIQGLGLEAPCLRYGTYLDAALFLCLGSLKRQGLSLGSAGQGDTERLMVDDPVS